MLSSVDATCDIQTHRSTLLEKQMDSFDLGMLQLNVDTCQSIIKFLEKKKEAAEQEDSNASVHRPQNGLHLDLKEYEAAWRLL